MNEPIGLGQILNERYLVEQRLGAGASGSVYLCQDMLLGSARVALKVFHPEVTKDATARVRIQRELLVSSSIEHHNIVRTYEAFWHGEQLVFTMEYAPGHSLREELRKHGPRPAAEVTWILCQICNGLSALHRHGLVHRDISCNNVIVGPNCQIKISDLGLVREPLWQKLEQAVPSSLGSCLYAPSTATLHGEIAGTPLYLSPEYIIDGVCDERSDIYGVGIIGFELLVGKAPFGDLSTRELFIAKTTQKPPQVRSAAPSVPAELAAIIDKAISLAAADRFQSSHEMLDRLTMLLSSTAPVGISRRQRFRIPENKQSSSIGSIVMGTAAIVLIAFSLVLIFESLMPKRLVGELERWVDDQIQILTFDKPPRYRTIGPDDSDGGQRRGR